MSVSGESPDEHWLGLVGGNQGCRQHLTPPEQGYHLVIVGAGAGGLVTAAVASRLKLEDGSPAKLRIALVEKHLMGGDCLNTGCVPSKAVLACSKVAHQVSSAHHMGVHVGEVDIRMEEVMHRMRRLRAEIANNDSVDRFESMGVDVYFGEARFTGSHEVTVGDAQLRFGKAVIATGARNLVPSIPGLCDVEYLTSDTVWNLTSRIDRLAVIGAGPIGCELAQAFRRLGSRVCLVDMASRVLPREDEDASREFEQALSSDGVQLRLGRTVNRVDREVADDGRTSCCLQLDGGESVRADRVLVCAGRVPDVDSLHLDNAGVAYDNTTGVQIDDHLTTTNDDVFAVGDCCTALRFTHVSDMMAHLVVRNCIFGEKRSLSQMQRCVPSITYTDPSVAHVGAYEYQLRQQGIEYTKYMRQFEHVDRTILDGQTRGFMCILCEKDTDTILGCTAVTEHPDAILSEVTLAMHQGIGLGELAWVVHPYPVSYMTVRGCALSVYEEQMPRLGDKELKP